ncbi:MAG: class I SAM-dependent methyltransferase [Chloroflexota bacterium]|nr:class I SAM-dependent methyltransferase [Chloroflexota bacterium]
MPSVFDVPLLYDIVLAHAPDELATEVHSLDQLLTQHGVACGSILELACGTCPHGIGLAQRGYAVTGLDRSSMMLHAAQRRAGDARVSLELVQADVIDFGLETSSFDAAIFMYETFPLITEYDDLLHHFAAVRKVMRHGGLYVIDLDARKHGVGASYGEWGRKTISLPNGSVQLWHEDFPGDWVQGTSVMALHCRATIDGSVYATDDLWRLRVYSPWELRVLMRTISDWQVNGFYSWRDLRTEIAEDSHYWMVLEAV